MNIFNSLGSNYTWGIAFKQLLARGSRKQQANLVAELSQHYGGAVTFTYKGREALELAFKQSGLPAGSVVAINGYTCYVVYRAIERAGYQAKLVDIVPGSMHFDVAGLKQAHQAEPKLAAVVVQNTLGYPVDIAPVEAYCRQHQLMLVEDLAHSLGAVYPDGREAGTVGDFVMLSFSQDKPLDVVAGGALIDRRPQAQAAAVDSNVASWQYLKNRAYGFWTSLIRGLYPLGLGRWLHAVLKKLNWLSTPMSYGTEGVHHMQPAMVSVLTERWQQRDQELAHRRAMAAIYEKELPKELQLAAPLGAASYLRFPLAVKSRENLLQHLKKAHIYVGDTWYDAPLAPKRYMAKTSYRTGDCPVSEQLVSQMINLPTHRHIDEQTAQSICATIRQWQALPSDQ